MMKSNTRSFTYPGYPISPPSATRKPSETLRPTWRTMRHNEEPAPATDQGALESKMSSEGLNKTGVDAVPKNVEPANATSAGCQTNTLAPGHGSIHAYGCVFHNGAQRLAVARPGEFVPVRFPDHSCMNRIEHAEDDDGVIVQEAGDYEITFELRIAAKASAPVTFKLYAGERALPGGTIVCILSSGIRECRGSVMAALRAGDRVGVAMTSVSACEATLTAGGVSAMLRLKKLD